MFHKLAHLLLLSVASIAATAQAHLKPYYEYDSATVKPGFPGGQQAFTAWLDSAVIASAINDSGSVKVWFIVEANGVITNVRVVEPAGNECDHTAERIIAAMPAWTGGKYNEHDVAVAVELTVRFE